jgi:hypothetical protein
MEHRAMQAVLDRRANRRQVVPAELIRLRISGHRGRPFQPIVDGISDEGEPRRLSEFIYRKIGDVQFPDLLLEIDALSNYSEALLGHRAETVAELLALYAAVLAHGTDIDAKSVAAMIPGLDTAWVSVAMRALETQGRLRRANERVVEFEGRIPICAHWGAGAKGSADMMSLEATRHLWSARTDPRRRTYAPRRPWWPRSGRPRSSRTAAICQLRWDWSRASIPPAVSRSSGASAREATSTFAPC